MQITGVIPSLVEILRSALSPKGRLAVERRPFALIATTVRNDSTVESFVTRAVQRGLRVEEVASPAGKEDVEFVDVPMLQNPLARIVVHRIESQDLP
mmetsp:Transcript_23027/g.55106  ORF Transcript_23027/g.55106 Transcript_23027/m.55106 type:complete len:97 (-) Transcript_23027:15-305(-)